jgi:hypothetical protein
MGAEYRNVLYAECEFCGRRWFVDSMDRGWEGFLSLPVSNHRVVCAERTPEQRRSVNKRDERRWALHPTRARIVNAVEHIGLVSVVESASNNASTRPLVRSGKKALSKPSASSVKPAGSPSGG